MISRNLNLEKFKLNLNEKNKNIIINSKKEIINIVKSENLIDIRTPSFLNIRLILSKKTSLVEFNNKVNKIDLVEKVYIKDFNKDYMNLRIKYLGKLEKIIDQLKNENINLKLIDDADNKLFVKWTSLFLNFPFLKSTTNKIFLSPQTIFLLTN